MILFRDREVDRIGDGSEAAEIYLGGNVGD